MQAGAFHGGERSGDAGVGGAAPPCQGVRVERQGLRRVAFGGRPAGGGVAPGEEGGVHVLGGHAQAVAAGRRGQDRAGPPPAPSRVEDAAQTGHVGVHAVGGALRGVGAPDGVDDVLHAHDFTRAAGQQAQHGALLGRSGVQLPAVPPGPYRPQELDSQGLPRTGHGSVAS